jgi:hypothetical protein
LATSSDAGLIRLTTDFFLLDGQEVEATIGAFARRPVIADNKVWKYRTFYSDFSFYSDFITGLATSKQKVGRSPAAELLLRLEGYLKIRATTRYIWKYKLQIRAEIAEGRFYSDFNFLIIINGVQYLSFY